MAEAPNAFFDVLQSETGGHRAYCRQRDKSDSMQEQDMNKCRHHLWGTLEASPCIGKNPPMLSLAMSKRQFYPHQQDRQRARQQRAQHACIFQQEYWSRVYCQCKGSPDNQLWPMVHEWQIHDEGISPEGLIIGSSWEPCRKLLPGPGFLVTCLCICISFSDDHSTLLAGALG